MTMTSDAIYWMAGIGACATFLLLALAVGGDAQAALERRLTRVGPQGRLRKIDTKDRAQQHAVRNASDSSIPVVDALAKMLPNPDRLRTRLAKTGRNMILGEYLLINAITVLVFYMLFRLLLSWQAAVDFMLALAAGLLLPHMVTGVMGGKRVRKFLGTFPEAIDTMCRGLRSGLPVTESIGAVGRELPDPVGIEFRRIADGVHMGKSLEAAMWDVTRRIDAPEFRFLIIAMAIQKETGGNLAETLGNLADLIRRRRQLRLKIKAMSSEARASAMIIGSMPFIAFSVLMLVRRDYVMELFRSGTGEMMIGFGVGWMMLGWAVMTKMINFEL